MPRKKASQLAIVLASSLLFGIGAAIASAMKGYGIGLSLTGGVMMFFMAFVVLNLGLGERTRQGQ